MDTSFETQIDTANLFLKDNNFEKSIENYKEALTLASTSEQKINLCNVLGRLYQKTKCPDKAIVMFNTSIELYGHVSNPETMAHKAAIYNNLGAIYIESDLKLSVKNYNLALDIYLSISNSGIKKFMCF